MEEASPSIGAQIDIVHTLRNEIRDINSHLNELKAQKTVAESGLLASLEAQGLEQSRGKSATATITKAVVPNVLDWEAFHQFIADNHAFYLLDRRASAPSYRELLESREGEAVPGVEPYERVTISIRSR